MIHSWVRICVIFVVYAFVVFLTFFLLASPVIDPIVDAFAGVETPVNQAEYDDQISITRTVLKFFFALFLGLPFAWLVGVVFSKEAVFSTYRRY